MRKIIIEQIIRARDQNKVFVQRMSAARLAPRDAESFFDLPLGKGSAIVEFSLEASELREQYNRRTQKIQLFIRGDVDLSTRNAVGRLNVG